MAETYRRIRADAAKLGIPRPSYECCRLLIRAARRERTRRHANRETLIRVALYLDGVQALERIDPTPALPL